MQPTFLFVNYIFLMQAFELDRLIETTVLSNYGYTMKEGMQITL